VEIARSRAWERGSERGRTVGVVIDAGSHGGCREIVLESVALTGPESELIASPLRARRLAERTQRVQTLDGTPRARLQAGA
jgi:hypothetical protein